MKLQDIKKEFEKYIVVKDKYVFEVLFSTIVGNFVIKKDPIWTMLVAPSSGGKTTLLNPCRIMSTIRFIDDLTENTFLSGFITGKGKQKPSFLHSLGGGIIGISDFTTIMSKNPLSKNAI